MLNQFTRTEMLFGKDAMQKLKRARVAVFGVGGVGGYAVEALARSGVGAITVIDNDTFGITNINRQILATLKTIGKYKVDAAAERIAEINPKCKVTTYKTFYLPETQDVINFSDYDYIIDAIDTVSGKLTIIENAYSSGVKVISCMGTGNKTDPCKFEVADVYDTSVCPLAKVMRRELKKRGIPSLKVVYSKEEPLLASAPAEEENAAKSSVPASCAFVPPVAGLILAGEVIKDLIK